MEVSPASELLADRFYLVAKESVRQGIWGKSGDVLGPALA